MTILALIIDIFFIFFLIKILIKLSKYILGGIKGLFRHPVVFTFLILIVCLHIQKAGINILDYLPFK